MMGKYPSVSDKSKLASVEKLCLLEDPYEINDQTNDLFVEAMKEVLLWHCEHCHFYDDLLNSHSFDPRSIRSISDIEKIPYILANFFKKHEILSIDRNDVFLHLTSSGTTGQKSQIFFDEWTIQSAQRMVDMIYRCYGWITPDSPTNYLLYGHEPEEGSKLGTAFTDNFLCKYAPVNEARYALRYTGDKNHKFDLFGCIEALKKYELEGLPVRIFGFPSFLYFTLKQMEKLGFSPLKLSKDSLVFLGGGWKSHQDKAISKEEFYALASKMLGIPNERLRDGFGSVEHCVPYIECSKHHFHVPVWSKVLIRDVKTLEVLGYDKIGYLNFVSPYITSVPANSVLMGDLAVLHDANDCDCELGTPWFEVKGRAGVSKNRSCAIAAAELLKDF